MLNMQRLSELAAQVKREDCFDDLSQADLIDLVETVQKLHHGLCFAQSVIKCGEPWTATCEQDIGAVLASMR